MLLLLTLTWQDLWLSIQDVNSSSMSGANAFLPPPGSRRLFPWTKASLSFCFLQSLMLLFPTPNFLPASLLLCPSAYATAWSLNNASYVCFQFSLVDGGVTLGLLWQTWRACKQWLIVSVNLFCQWTVQQTLPHTQCLLHNNIRYIDPLPYAQKTGKGSDRLRSKAINLEGVVRRCTRPIWGHSLYIEDYVGKRPIRGRELIDVRELIEEIQCPLLSTSYCNIFAYPTFYVLHSTAPRTKSSIKKEL